jgi:hypothetical protein
MVFIDQRDGGRFSIISQANGEIHCPEGRCLIQEAIGCMGQTFSITESGAKNTDVSSRFAGFC